MRHKRAGAATVAGVAVAALLGATPVGAQEAGPGLSIDPTSGPVGTTIEVSGTQCQQDKVEFVLLSGTGLADMTGFVDMGAVTPDADGNWSGSLVVREDMTAYGDEGEEDKIVPTTPGPDYFVTALCGVFEAPPAEPADPTPAAPASAEGDDEGAALTAAEDDGVQVLGKHDGDDKKQDDRRSGKHGKHGKHGWHGWHGKKRGPKPAPQPEPGDGDNGDNGDNGDDGDDGDDSFFYDPVPFEVTGETDTPPTTEAPSETPTPAPAEPAKPVKATPKFTG